MFYYFSDLLADWYSGFNVLQYITLRTVFAAISALLISVITGPIVIKFLTYLNVGQTIRAEGPKSHYSKKGTPTMGGVLIILTITLTTLLWADIYNRYVMMALTTMLLFALIGGIDDYIKLKRGDSAGLSVGVKFFWQSVIALTMVSLIYHTAQYPAELEVIVPFAKNIMLDIGPWFILLAYLTVVGSSNAVNLTDGLDGLAVLPVALIAAALGVFAYVSGHVNFAAYLNFPYLPEAAELTVFCGALAGTALGFLWFNTYPAQVFMGDVGALSLGAALAIIAVLVRQELLLFLMGGIFVAEALSVILQVASFRATGKRIFRMAPLHHHFELSGWKEPKVIVRFWIITLLLVLAGLATLKIR